jgi:methionyl-tRNA synthetase
MGVYDPRAALADLWSSVIVFSNQLIEKQQPWKLAKDPAKRDILLQTLWVLGEHLAHTAVLLLPFLPESSVRILQRLKLKTDRVILKPEDFSKPLVATGTAIEKGEPLFPRLDEKAS